MADSSQILYYFLAPDAPFSNTKMGKSGTYETAEQTKGLRGTPRNATGRDGAPKFGYPALAPTIFWRIPSEFSNISGARHPLPRHPNEKGGGMRNYRPEQRAAAEQRGTLRNQTERLNLATPRWGPPYFGGLPPPNSLNFLAPDAPLSQRPTGKGGEIRNYRPNKGAPRRTTERYRT